MIWMAPCTAMAVPTGSMASSRPSRISPPAMPKMPESIDVPKTATSMAAPIQMLTAVSD